ncbi:DUF1572 domain-containing protein [Bacillus sp. FJAT-42376]|uniref:DUF1572 family protein n=1 Tax=Bacillus sp. FJAT-42376 TaxID=2014076 RepID=UPI000F4F7C39|nr:DUF1572 family protein [Bacillus sp. FJAT-42376]AZB43451.1 DUF1572 domain-containing protein [Bacillus sp. FJAT-42376]
MSVGTVYLKVVMNRFKGVKNLGDRAMEQLTEQDLHWKQNEETNSIAVIVKHMNGNMVSRWTDFLTTDGEKPDRSREQEFLNDLGDRADVMQVWENGWNVLFHALGQLTEEDLLKEIFIRGESHMVMDAIERQMAHYAYHTGQIVHIGKERKDAEWKSLSIPRGESDIFLQKMLEKHQKR